jgi:hypothetical protein
VIVVAHQFLSAQSVCFINDQRQNRTNPTIATTSPVGLGAEVMISFRCDILLVDRDPVSYLCRWLGFLIVNTSFGAVFYFAAQSYTP